MKKLPQIVTVLLSLLAAQFAVAHEGVHGAGQLHVGDHHMGMFEMSLMALALAAAVYGAIKVYGSKK